MTISMVQIGRVVRPIIESNDCRHDRISREGQLIYCLDCLDILVDHEMILSAN